jgi:hypothetical protein
MFWLAGLVALSLVGCDWGEPDRSCENHRALDAATAEHRSDEERRLREMIEREIRNKLSYAEIVKKAPTSDCPRCDKLIGRTLMVR